ncbi:hypothetical protein F4810DRAFT_643862 [Camillea tinctor]|nr:hypothetical protein F4810DRAFT_643862 [Camillea tinctor]
MRITYDKLYRAGFQAMLDAGSTLEGIKTRIYQIGNLISRAHWDTTTNQALLQPWVNRPENEQYRQILQLLSVREWNETLRWLLWKGTYVHTALDKGVIVGAVTVFKLEGQLRSGDIEVKKEVVEEKEYKMPDFYSGMIRDEWFKQLHAWAWSDIRTSNLYQAIGANLEAHMRAQQPNLWRISSLAVAEDYRGRGIGKELLRRALSDVPAGGVAYLLAEPGHTKIYQDLGFTFSRLKDHKCVRLEVLRDGESSEIIEMSVMILKKPAETINIPATIPEETKPEPKRKREDDDPVDTNDKPEPRKRRKIRVKTKGKS